MKLQIIKIFTFWAAFSFLVNSVIESTQVTPAAAPMSNIQLTKPSVVKVKANKKPQLASYTAVKGKRIAMK